MRGRLTWSTLVALLGVSMLAACSDTGDGAVSALVLVFSASEAPAGEPDRLLVWLKEGTDDRRALPDPESIDIGGRDMTMRPVTVRLGSYAEVEGPLYVYATAVAAAGEERWVLGRPLLVGRRVIEMPSSGTEEITMSPFEITCDLDGDYFQRCYTGVCCADFADEPEFIDCLDDDSGLEPVGSKEVSARAAHPFVTSGIDGDEAHCGNGVDEDCDGMQEPCPAGQEDRDNDGYNADVDCDDEDPRVNPGLTEVCGNEVDEDCDGTAECDEDGDGFTTVDDCNDADPRVFPGATESRCDGRDDNCNGEIDENLPCDDIDRDGVSNDDEDAACGVRDGELPARYDAGRYPGATDRCGNGIDEDCDGSDAECPTSGDEDGDGYVAIGAGGDDCNDNDRWVYPGAPERCGDAVDQDCQGGDLACANDADGDGYPASIDCDDNDAAVRPGPASEGASEGVMELCDGIDNDCDGLIDEGNPLTDGSGMTVMPRCGTAPPINESTCRQGWMVCSRVAEGEGSLSCQGETPPEDERCDGFDNDCDSVVDDGVLNACNGCGPLTQQPGVVCGDCSRGMYVCDGAEAVRCAGDPGLNDCGGCVLTIDEPGSPCGPCGEDRFVCNGVDATRCDGNTYNNVCDGCNTLPQTPGTNCGTCGSGNWICDGPNNVRCSGADSGATNACGGCQDLDDDPGDPCNDCGMYECSGNNSVTCNDPGQNACGGCATLNPAVGSMCGSCGTRVCMGQNNTMCDDPGTNSCGGCSSLGAEPGTMCDDCGTYVCAGQNDVTCNDPGFNQCGGCEADPPGAVLGQSCESDGCGVWTCNGTQLECPSVPQNACGGCADLGGGVPGQECDPGGGECGRWACDGLDALMCETGLSCGPRCCFDGDMCCTGNMCRGSCN